ncbi:hypothetical protein VNO77_43125 [Canavalia gladiata]|uniref:Uncharacterized protein n=1 Tax=Canavalia gladiata TaxID=3824 RepID=A0AAN9PPN6_CANGL
MGVTNPDQLFDSHCRIQARNKTELGCSVNIYLIKFIRLPHILMLSPIYSPQVTDATLILAGFPTVKHSKLTGNVTAVMSRT